LARAAPDGNTLLIATSSTLAINPSLYPKLPYDPLKDFAPIGMIASVPLALVVSPSIAVRHVNDLVSLSNARPGGLSYASAGNGSPQHLAAEMFKAATDAELRHVPYGGSAAALTDVLSGQVDMMFVDLAPALPHLRAKRLRALGVSSLTRQQTLPDVPALAASGVAELRRFEAVAWQSLVAPAGTPRSLVDRLNRLVVEMLDQPPVREGLQRDGVESRSSSPDDLATVIRTDTERWARIIKAAGISIA
jgi:tripartite-type tricarboxylate transporter receptor subunit TctC